jgi:phosphomannomutase
MMVQDQPLSCFKAYDVRGRVPDQIDEQLALGIGQAYAEVVAGARRVAVGHDIRLSSPAISEALVQGLNRAGVDVVDLGLCGTEEIYFATFHLGLDGGIMITASHNPKDHNGLKFVREGSRPISADTGLMDIERVVRRGGFSDAASPGGRERVDLRAAYIEHLLSYVDRRELSPLRVVVNPGNGCAGPVLELLERELPFSFVKLQMEPDGNFPNGVPNPLLPENRGVTAGAVKRQGAQLGVAWDGDFDRCFLFDEQGTFVEGYYIVGLLASQILRHHPGARIIHDPRLTWATIELVRQAGGVPVQCKSGHAFIKERMRAEDAVYGGEMSAHHYFREFSYCDSGMIPWMLVAQAVCRTGKPLSELVGERVAAFPISGEINRKVADAAGTLARIKERYQGDARSLDETDGISLDFGDWRFNLRMSNTEPLVRLNVETRGDAALCRQKTEELLAQLEG